MSPAKDGTRCHSDPPRAFRSSRGRSGMGFHLRRPSAQTPRRKRCPLHPLFDALLLDSLLFAASAAGRCLPVSGVGGQVCGAACGCRGGRKRRQSSISRVLFPPLIGEGRDHLSGTAVAGGLKRPTRGLGGPLQHPLLGLAPDGVCRASPVTRAAVGSYIKAVRPPPFHPCL